MQTVKRSSRILELLSGTDALRKLRAENKARTSRAEATESGEVVVVDEANAGPYADPWNSLRDDGIVAEVRRSRVTRLALAMNLGRAADS